MKGLNRLKKRKGNLVARRKGKFQKLIESKGTTIPKVFKDLLGISPTSGYHYDHGKGLEGLPVGFAERIMIALNISPNEWSAFVRDALDLNDFVLTEDQKDKLFRDQRTRKK